MRTTFPARTSILALALALLIAACGGGDDAGGGDDGKLVITGSSTVEPISIAVAEAYRSVDADLNIAVTGPGTGDGFKAFCEGDADISDASRPIKESEAAACSENGIQYVELKVGIDGIAVLTSAENTAVECLAFGDLYALVGPESIGFETWSEANDLAGTVGGNGGLPDADLVISAPGPESGTYDSFVEIVLEDIAEAQGQDPDSRPDYSSAADDNVIIETVSSNPTSFGWVGFAFAAEATDVKLVAVSETAGGDCIIPTAETIASNEYPISRDLFIYINTTDPDNAGISAFVDYYMSFGLDEAVADVGYVPLTEDAKAETRAVWEGR